MTADADFRTGRAVVTYDPAQTNPEQIVQAFNGQSFYRARVAADEGGSATAGTGTLVLSVPALTDQAAAQQVGQALKPFESAILGGSLAPGQITIEYDPTQVKAAQFVEAIEQNTSYEVSIESLTGPEAQPAGGSGIVLPLIFGLIGFVTPCSLGINTVFLGYIMGKERSTRIRQAVAFALTRGLFLAALGLLFGLIGQQVVGFQLVYRKLIGALFILLGVVFIIHLYRPLPMPSLGLAGKFQGSGAGSAVAMGTLFGLDIPACSSPLVFALLAQTVLVGDIVGGAISLYLFGLGMSLPLVVLSISERPNEWLVRWSRRSRETLYYTGAGLLVLVGIATFSPRIMGAVGTVFDLAVQVLGG